MGTENSCGESIGEIFIALIIAAIVVGLGFISGQVAPENLIAFGTIAFIVIWIGVHLEEPQKSKISKSRYDRVSGTKLYNSISYPNNWSELQAKALARDEYKCGNCGSTQNLMVHHIIPLSKGGSNLLSNLRTLCEDCHKKLHPHMK
jgi:hypothetical protein